jgi:hypothetical protein
MFSLGYLICVLSEFLRLYINIILFTPMIVTLKKIKVCLLNN